MTEDSLLAVLLAAAQVLWSLSANWAEVEYQHERG